MKTQPAVEFRNITKRFPGVTALRDVSLRVMSGSCHGLVGENGAGKSTLGKILAGIHTPDEGTVLIRGEPARLQSPRDALTAGIGMVHQELAFCENMTVAENLCLGHTPSRGIFVSTEGLMQKARDYLAVVGAALNIGQRLGNLPISQQQIVQIAAAVGRGASVLIFDEPTSSLSQAESERLFQLIRRLQTTGTTSIYISHRLEEVFALCDTVSVLRDGCLVDTLPIEEVSESRLIQMMIGRPFEAYRPEHLNHKPGRELFRVEDLSSPKKFASISFRLHAGEILGVAGLVGSGRTEIAEALFGLDHSASGDVYMEGRSVGIPSPGAALGMGIGLLPEDRKRHGLVLSMTARQNVSLPLIGRLATIGWVKDRAERDLVAEYLGRTCVRATNIDVPAAGLSGGNQQKLVLARWLAMQCRVLIVDEPTRGIDVGAKVEIHGLLDGLAALGSAVLLISSELPEVLSLATRILVLREGRLVGELTRDQFSQENVMSMMAGIRLEEKAAA